MKDEELGGAGEMNAAEILQAGHATKIVYGPGALHRLSELVDRSWRKAMIVLGRTAMRNLGFPEALEAELDKAGIVHELYEGIEPDPADITIKRLAEKITEARPDVLIALGGGSVMDSAKLANVLAHVRGELNDYVGIGGHISAAMQGREVKLLPVVTIPTTSGSGSEVTRYAVFTDTDQDLKKIIVDDVLRPTLAVIDPRLTVSCSARLTATVGLDTLSHLIEGYLSKVGSNHVDPWALAGLRLVWSHLPRAVKHGHDLHAREAMAQAATIGGLVINEKGTGFPHGFSFSFHRQMSHGNAVALTLPACWAYSLPAVEEKTRRLAEVMGLNPAGDIREVGREAIVALLDFYTQVGHPTRLCEIKGVDEHLLAHAAERVSQNELKLRNAPRPVHDGRRTLLTILQAAYTGDIDSLLNF